MAVTLLTGVEASTNNTDNNPRDMAAGVAELEPNVAPLLRLLDKLSKEAALNPKIEWLEDESMPRITTLSASAASNAGSFSVTSDYFRVGDVVRFTAQGFALVVTATGAGAISGTKIGGTAQASASSGSEVYIVSSANAEGSTLREIKYPQLVTASNYAQNIRTPFGVTGTEQATKHYGGDERARLQNKFGKEHARAIEQTLFFGARDIQGTNQRFCGGLREFITTNVTNDSGGLTEAEWLAFLKTGFRFGSERKVAFCSPTAVAALEGYARSNIKVEMAQGNAEKYGIQMSTYVSGQGIVDLVMHRDWNDSANYGGYVFLVDIDALKLRPLRDTRLRTNVQAPDYDGFKDEYLTEVSLEIKHERRHAILTGIT
jgi:uncharacterized protein DUF5309